ncbi:MAG: Gfo/Idh/MocA family oxidoreductase [Planctomycetota bacterium]|nr:Gfo/Idh/MocA family oxidoreductase [Planctomycetota bacterium]
MNLTPDEREVGRSNYYDVLTDYDRQTYHRHRRGFLKQVIAAGGVTAAGVGALYFNYGRPANPVRVAVIGTGDEGNVLIGALNPNYVEVKAICDIRPSSIFRAFHGDWSSANAKKHRKGLMDVYGYQSEDEARKKIHVEMYDYREVLKRKDIDAVIIALPLFLHAKVAIDAMKAGKHVLTEKLMAHNIAECKWMGRVSEEKKLYCATGHQRHYSVLYDNAINLIKWGLLGEIHHIRAQWHRGNLPGRDSWSMPLPGGEVLPSGKRIDQLADKLKGLKNSKATDKKTLMQIRQWSELIADGGVSESTLGNAGYGTDDISALEELIRWRIWDRTGGGLMAELGSHQLDAASIFISALGNQKILPLTVHAAGGRHIFPKDRDADDHVYCTFEFPGPGYEPGYRVGYNDPVYDVPNPKTPIPDGFQDPNKRIVVTYSSINGNGYGGYGEVVMGTKGTLVLEKEKDVLIYKNSSTSTKVGAKLDAKKGEAVLDTTQSGDSGPAQAATSGPVSRGYAEQIEHWAYCIASKDWGNQPRCSPKVALADAVMALTARLAIKNSNNPKLGDQQHGFIRFKPEWFDVDADQVPEPEDACSVESVKQRLDA